MASSILIKQLNKKRVREELRAMRESTIFTLSQKTALSVVTVKSALEEMTESGEVFPWHTVPSGGGRPSMLYQYQPHFRHALVIYGFQKNEGNLIRALVIDLYGECVWRREAVVRDVQPDSFCPHIEEALREVPNVGVIGFGLPGVEENGVITVNDYHQLVGLDFLDFYQRKYDLPVIYLNDVNAAVKGCKAAYKELKCLVGIYFPRIYGPGAGMVIGGEVHTGAHNYAGEIDRLLPDVDWMHMDYNDTQAVCGAIARLLAIYCRVLAPDRFILYGDFFRDEHASLIRSGTEELLGSRYGVNIAVSTAFEKDFEQGMILAVLQKTDETLFSAKGWL
jgi:predicted NBD/HSP70 family sugar kinase